MADHIGTIPVPCPCGEVWQMPGRWAFVGEKLCDFGAVYLFFRCPACGDISYTPDIDPATAILEFFQVIAPKEVNGQPLLERVTYDIGNWNMLTELGGYGSAETKLEDTMGVRFAGRPAADLTCGICAPQGVLPLQEVRQCVMSGGVL